MEQLLQGIPQVSVYIDDILIATETETEHLRVLGEVLKRLAKAELKVKKHKYKFMVPSVYPILAMLLTQTMFVHSLKRLRLFVKHLLLRM